MAQRRTLKPGDLVELKFQLSNKLVAEIRQKHGKMWIVNDHIEGRIYSCKSLSTGHSARFNRTHHLRDYNPNEEQDDG